MRAGRRCVPIRGVAAPGGSGAAITKRTRSGVLPTVWQGVTVSHPPSRTLRRVVVLGAGIAGLTAAYELSRGGEFSVLLLDASPRTGGKLLRGEVAGVVTDLGAEAMLARRPEAVDLASAVGLGSELVHPVTITAGVWSRGAVRPLPGGHVMGVPTSVRSLAASGIVSPLAAARAAADRAFPRPWPVADVSVGAFVGGRLGRAVVERLVEPLLGGVYAGRAEMLSLNATLPQVAKAAQPGMRTSLLRALRSRPAAGRPAAGQPAAGRPAAVGPVFAGFAGGVGQLTEALTEAIAAAGVEVRCGTTARSVERTPTGWRIVIGPAVEPDIIEADAVVLAVPAAPAARLIASSIPAAAAELAAIEYASMAVVTLVYAGTDVDKPLPGSGFLVPAVERRLIKAATFSSNKWGWYAQAPGSPVVVRCSIGRFGDVADLQRADDELVAGARRDLADAVGLRAVPRGTAVTRWGGALPQYAVGHLDRVARIRAALAGVPGVVVCGAAYDGIGIPACIASARAAVAQLRAAPAP